MISLDFSIFIQIVLFVIFWYIMRRVLFTPVGRLMEERERRMDGTRRQAQVMLEEAKQLQAEYEAEIAKARDEGETLKSEIRAEAARARDQIMAQGHELAAQRTQSIHSELQRDLEEARRTIAQQAEGLAQEMAAKVLGREIA